MTKPWEEEWEQDEHDPDWVTIKRNGKSRLLVEFGPVATEPGPEDIARARLASKAPKMARALLDAREQFRMQMEGNPEWHRKGRVEALAAGIDELLREAGVLE